MRLYTPGMEVVDSRVSPSQLFGAFFFVGITGIGGAIATHIHHAVVEKRGWVSEEEFLEGFTLTQLVPGSNNGNLAAYLGLKLAGSPGALAAVLGLVLPGAVIAVGLAALYLHLREVPGNLFQGALHGVAAATLGLSTSMVLRLVPSSLRAKGGWLIALAAFGLVGLLHFNLLGTLALLAPLALFLNRPGARA